jgi:O-antigen/teichoic acid export membrane protein
MTVLDKILQSQNPKSKTVLRNVFFSFFVKGLNITVNFLTVPLVLSFLNSTQYGVWLTLTAVLSWFSLIDLGFGNGLRNHLVISITTKNLNEGKIYVSTTYAALSVIFGSLIILFLITNPYINWITVFNAPASMARDLNYAVLFSICFLFIQFIVRLINTVLLSFQRAAMADFTNTLVQLFILMGLFALKILHLYSLTAMAVVCALVPVVVFLSISLFLFFGIYADIRPSIHFVKTEYVKNLLQLGLKFFVIQIAGLVLYASDNFIIAHLFAPADVTVYNIAFKYFSIVSVLFTIVLAPFWSMTTKAQTEGDWAWIKTSIKGLIILWSILFMCGLVQLIIAHPVYKLWTNNKVLVPATLSFVMFIYFIVSNWCSIFSYFLNGVGKVKVQLYISAVGMIINIPLAIFLAKICRFGVIGIPAATIFTMGAANIVALIQYNKIVHLKAKGIWNK